jgi:hypothetical protein
MVHKREPFSAVHGPDLLRKKSRSTINWPIFSYKGARKASSPAASPFVPALFRAKQRSRPVQQHFFPRMDLTGVHTEPARQFRDRAFPANCRQRDLRLELGSVLLPSIGHVSPSAVRPLQGKTPS